MRGHHAALAVDGWIAGGRIAGDRAEDDDDRRARRKPRSEAGRSSSRPGDMMLLRPGRRGDGDRGRIGGEAVRDRLADELGRASCAACRRRWSRPDRRSPPVEVARQPAVGAVAGDILDAPRIVRSVSEKPSEAAAPCAAEMPGTMATSIPAAWQASISSVARPKISGSPPLRRTTFSPACGERDHPRVDLGLAQEGPWPVLPTAIRSASRRASSNISGPTRSS